MMVVTFGGQFILYDEGNILYSFLISLKEFYTYQNNLTSKIVKLKMLKFGY